MRSTDDPLESSFRSARRDYAIRQRVLEERWNEQRRAARERAEDVVGKLSLDIDELPGRLRDAFRGTATAEEIQGLIDAPTDGEIDAIEKVVLSADLDPDVQVDLLTDMGVAKAMARLRLEAERVASETDRAAEAELQRIEEEASVAIRAIDEEYRGRMAAVIAAATEASKQVDQKAADRLHQVVEEAERQAEQATRDARMRARRAARQRARRRGR